MSGVNVSGGYPKLFEGSLHIPENSHPARRLPADGDPSYQLNFVVVTREPFLQPEKTTFGHWAVLVLVTTYLFRRSNNLLISTKCVLLFQLAHQRTLLSLNDI